MKRSFFTMVGLLLSVSLLAGTWASVNIDRETSAAMRLAYDTQVLTETMNNESVQKMLDHYKSAEVAAAGIFSSKWLDRKALQNAGLFGNAEENFYYKRIYMMVSMRIMPKILDVAALAVRHPDKALYWGPYLFKTCEQVKQLCMTFETVVCNGKISFQDICFLAVSDDLKPLFDLARLGDVDWRAVWEHLCDFGSGITKEDIEDDLDNLMTAGGAIASAGGAVLDSLWTNGSKVGHLFRSKPGEVIALYDRFRDYYDTFSDPVRIKDLVMAQIVSTDSTGVARLFKVDGYNISSYVSDYLREMTGQYYTQRWYIYCRDRGRELVCDYSPPMEHSAFINSPEWYRVYTFDTDYSYTADDYEQSLRNSEGFAGWSRDRCRELSSHGDGYAYDFRNTITYRRIVLFQPFFVFAHAIRVFKRWDIREEVYEEFFDSQYDSEAAVQARFNAKLEEYNCNEEGKVYFIGKGSKNYYTAADADKMKGCATVSFQMECDDGGRLGEGNFSWKEDRTHRHGINEESHLFAMETTLGARPDLTAIEENIAMYREQLSSLQSQIRSLEEQNNVLLAEIARASIEDAEALRAQYNANLSQIRALTSSLGIVRSTLEQWRQAKQELVDDYAGEEDDVTRIPAIMHELESSYGITWSDGGSWEGDTFVRHGHMPNIDGELTFRAELTLQRSEKYFFGVRIHRAILAVHWTLEADYTTHSIVDYMDLDAGLSDDEKARLVNDRLRALMADNPDCTIEPNYAYSDPQEATDDDDAVHLLWVCDRLAIARDVDYRLSKIYAQLILIEKFMRSRETFLDHLREALGIYVLDGAGRTRLGNKSFRRWWRSAAAAARGERAADVLSEDDDDV